MPPEPRHSTILDENAERTARLRVAEELDAGSGESQHDLNGTTLDEAARALVLSHVYRRLGKRH